MTTPTRPDSRSPGGHRRRPRIATSACFFHADFQRPVFKGKTLLYLEQSIAQWIMKSGGLPFMIPPADPATSITLASLVAEMDGLVLQGGSDVSPKSYGEDPLRPEWSGDYVRDQYEIALYREFVAQGKPVLGICRGAQLINVACGGTLYQDIALQVPGAFVHRDWNTYDQNFHHIVFSEGGFLKSLFAGMQSARVNSVHHQALNQLGHGLAVAARSEPDRLIEAIQGTGPTYVRAVQWHPEYQRADDREHLDGRVIFDDFIQAVANTL